MREIVLSTATARSRILIGTDALHLSEYCGYPRKLILVTDSNVRRLHGDFFASHDVIEIPIGEAAKNLETISFLYREFFKRELQRTDWVVAVGGGCICDSVGFAAATYVRGLRCGYVATTLLAQVDASIGGKNGVNFSGFKNLIGTIRQPEFCICDTRFLGTLPDSELSDGFAEVIKHAAIDSADLFSSLESQVKNRTDQAVLNLAVYESVRIKAGIVGRDENEQGERRKLNFGHTLGHAIEAELGISHGKAVATGMVLAATISSKLGLLSQTDLERLNRLIEAYGLPTKATFNRANVINGIRKDKKRVGDTIHMVLLRGIGTSLIQEVPLQKLEELI